MMISANATSINMTTVAQMIVEEGSTIEYMCETNCAYPGPPVVLWYVADQTVDINDGYPINKFMSCDYNGSKIKSVLHLTARRQMNKKKVKCVLENDDTKLGEHNLNVKCKY